MDYFWYFFICIIGEKIRLKKKINKVLRKFGGFFFIFFILVLLWIWLLYLFIEIL